MNEEMDEIRKQKEAELKLAMDMAKDSSKQGGIAYVKQFGPEQVTKDIRAHRESIQLWNKVMASSIPFTLNTIDAFLLAYGGMPNIVGMEIINNPKYQQAIKMLSAIRNHLIAERDERMRLSTGDDNKPKA